MNILEAEITLFFRMRILEACYCKEWPFAKIESCGEKKSRLAHVKTIYDKIISYWGFGLT
jgi:hypothetical protein